MTALVRAIASSVVDRPAAAALAFISKILAVSAVSPKAEITWYSPRLKSAVLFPTSTAMPWTVVFSSSTRAVLQGISVATSAMAALKSILIFTAAPASPTIGSVRPAVMPPPISDIFVPMLSIREDTVCMLFSKPLVSPRILTHRLLTSAIFCHLPTHG
ncbi:MAG: hypothetical protein DDT38_01518 [Firmicutes bacterium]|nr:hypothetical protein [candidate division NPL-UPA2 bacterium]